MTVHDSHDFGPNETRNSNQHHDEHDIHVAMWKFEYVQQPFIITVFIIAIGIFKIVFHHAHKFSKIVPESCILIIIGCFMGFLFLIEKAEAQLKFLQFDSQTFFLFLLPPIILESAYSLRDRAFVENLGIILLYAVVGTILNIFIIGPCLFALSFVGFFESIGLLECLIFSALVSAVDPVAVLAIFQEVGVNKMLYFMVFGESLFNDAVTVVVYNMVVAFTKIDRISVREISLGIASFLCVSFGGIVIGSFFGFLTAFITKYTSKVRVVEPILLFGLSYLSYLMAEMVHFSGIISIICCGIMQSHYAVENISSKSYISIHYFSKVASGVTESLIFIILGVMLVTQYNIWKDFSFGFALPALALCIVVRFSVVFFLAYFVNHFLMGVREVTKHEQLIVGYGGLRGAVTFSLAFMWEIDVNDPREVKTKHILLTTSYLIIFFTVFVQGITIKPLVKLIRIQLQAKDTSLCREINRAMLENTMAGVEEIIGHRGANYWTVVSKYLSQKFLRPMVQKFPHKKGGSLVATYHEVSMQSQLQRIASDVSIPKQAALWNELELFDAAAVSVTCGDMVLDAQDERTLASNKERREAALAALNPKLPKLKLDTPEDLLAFQDMLLTPPHKKVHYVMDKNLSNEGTQGLTRNLRHLATLRRSKQSNNRLSVRPQLIQSALLPLGMGMMVALPSMKSIKEERESAPSTAQNTFRPTVDGENKDHHETNIDHHQNNIEHHENNIEHHHDNTDLHHGVHFSLDTNPNDGSLKRNDYDPYEDIPFFDLSSRR